MTSCAAIISLIILTAANTATLVSFGSPNWLNTPRTQGINIGLWQDCNKTTCTWIFSNAWELELLKPGLWKATQILATGSVGSGLVALVLAALGLRCPTCKCDKAVAVFLGISSASMVSALGTFGANGKEQAGIPDSNSQDCLGLSFGYSFWLALGAAATNLIPLVIYIFKAKTADEYLVDA